MQVFLDSFPQLVGTQFGDLVCRFSDGLVLGLLNRRSGACDIAPPAETLVSSLKHPLVASFIIYWPGFSATHKV